MLPYHSTACAGVSDDQIVVLLLKEKVVRYAEELFESGKVDPTRHAMPAVERIESPFPFDDDSWFGLGVWWFFSSRDATDG